jgi:conjugative transfer region lipoprotein (TIGR03751 family)
MVFRKSIPRSLALCCFGATLAGCTVFAPRGSPLPSDGPTMVEVYRNHMATGGATSITNDAEALRKDRGRTPRDRLPLRGAEDDASVTQRTALSEPLNNRFERLPNPDLTMFVYPHLSQGRYPVPGYTTVFPMYDGVQYAMPGEVAPRHQAGSSVVYPAPARARAANAAEDRADEIDRAKREYYASLASQSPTAARVLPEFDRLHSVRCGVVLSAQELAKTASASPVFAQMVQLTQQRRDTEAFRFAASELTCPVPPAVAPQ